MPKKDNCKICGGIINKSYFPMEEWEIEGPLCGKCYSKKLNNHYPGEHVRINPSEEK